MRTPRPDVHSLFDSLSAHRADHWLWGADVSVPLHELVRGSALGARRDELRGKCVLVRTRDPLAAALALIEIDGLARRLVLCPPDLASEHIPYVIATAEVDAIVSDDFDATLQAAGVEQMILCTSTLGPVQAERGESVETEWILFTSGTTGVPKMVVHTLATLTGAIAMSGSLAGSIVWSTFYDIRRYGGLQILLRAIIGGGSLVLSSEHEAVADFLTRAASHGVSHMTGTPSHWRRALMMPAAHGLSPRYARLSGEIADQAILDKLAAFFPSAQIAHAFASTEAGVAFEVGDGRAGFPAALLFPTQSPVHLEVEDGSLRIRSPRTARRYLGPAADSLLDQSGFVDTGDIVELRGDRYYFVGRRGGIINVGGLKVHPEEVEAVLNRHPNVRMSLVKAKKNAVTGSVVVAEVVPALDGGSAELESELLAACRNALAVHKVPATIRVVPSLGVSPSGKMARRDA